MNTLRVNAIWTSGAVHTTGTYERFLDTIAARHIPYFEASARKKIRQIVEACEVEQTQAWLDETRSIWQNQSENSTTLVCVGVDPLSALRHQCPNFRHPTTIPTRF
jgi:hypothetical protein